MQARKNLYSGGFMLMSSASPSGIRIDSGTMTNANLMVVPTAPQKSALRTGLVKTAAKLSNPTKEEGNMPFPSNPDIDIPMPRARGKMKNRAKQSANGPRKATTLQPSWSSLFRRDTPLAYSMRLVSLSIFFSCRVGCRRCSLRIRYAGSI